MSELLKIQETLRNYVIKPDITTDNFQPIILRRTPQFWRLNDVPNCPASTNLIPKHDSITGEVIDFVETINKNAEDTPQNSTSLRRMPNPEDDAVRGSIMNCPFWPGSFDVVEKTLPKINADDVLNIDKLLTIPPDFDVGFEFENQRLDEIDDILKVEDNRINLLQSLQNAQDIDEWLSQLSTEEANKKPNETQNDIIISTSEDESHDLLEKSNSVILEMSKEPPLQANNTKWVEIIDVSQPVTDFNERIKEPAKTYPFELDTFQKQAILKLESHEYIFVAAHTSAGKTVVAEYAIALSKRHMSRTIYTSPIKALSNQKYRDFKKEFNDVGLITGDIQIEPTASCLIMTTEILRSMLYCGSDVTRDLEYVILDEVHYINDSERGHVWEEVLILLPPHVTVIMLSATVQNTSEFADWVGNIQNRKVYVVSTFKRPVPLMHYLYVSQINGKTLKDQMFNIVDANNQLLAKNYSEAEQKLNACEKNSGKDNKSSTDNKSKKNYSKNKMKDVNSVGQGPLRNKKSDENQIWSKLLKHLQSENKLPVIVFVLSRKRCDDLAKMIKIIDLNSPEEKTELDKFYKLCLSKLNTSDQKLPQVIWMKNALQRGIGVHHSGILPVLKEVVEMCFNRGLVKVLFATETFAMGVNMPAKTVVFDSIIKFDGINRRTLKSAEYIQMAGRAGRRGHDDTGTAIILCKSDTLPSIVDLKTMILNKPEKLESKFILRYALLLTCLRIESIKVENIMSSSYNEYYSKKRMIQHAKELEIEKERFSKIKDLGDHLQPLCDFFDVAVDYLEHRRNLLKKSLSHSRIVKELEQGKVILVIHEKYNKLGIVLSSSIKSTIKVLVLDHQKGSSRNSLESNYKEDNLWNEILSLTPKYQFFYPEGIGGHNIIEIDTKSSILNITKNTFKIDADNIIQNWNQRQMERFKDSPPSQKVKQAISDLNSLNELYLAKQNKVQFINFEEYYDVEQIKIAEEIKKIKCKLDNLLSYTQSSNFEEDFRLVYERKSVMKKISELELKKSWKSLSLYPDYCNRLNVLKELGFVNPEDEEVELKGKIACEMGQNEIILTELISNNIIHGLNRAETAALLSGLVFQSPTKVQPKPNKKLEKAINDMISINNKIEETEEKYGVPKFEIRERLNFGLVDVVYEWANNKPFSQIIQLTDVQEGIIVRCIQQLDELIRNIRTAAKRIGDRTLENKMEEVSTAIRRDIVFAASLYTTLD